MIIKGKVIEIGDNANGQPEIVVHSTREEIAGANRNFVFQDVVVARADDLRNAVVDGFDRGKGTVELMLAAMPEVAVGESVTVMFAAPTKEQGEFDKNGTYFVFVDGMDGDAYNGAVSALYAAAHAFRNGASRVEIKKSKRL